MCFIFCIYLSNILATLSDENINFFETVFEPYDIITSTIRHYFFSNCHTYVNNVNIYVCSHRYVAKMNTRDEARIREMKQEYVG